VFEELKDKETKNNQGYIYVLMNEQNYIKIGITSNPYQRFNSLSGSNTGGVEIIRYYLSPIMYIGKTIEGIMHRTFKEYRQSGEWFYGVGLYYEDVINYLDQLCSTPSFIICNENRKKYIENQVSKGEKRNE